MNITNQLVLFSIDDGRYALNLHVVERVIPSVAITRLPDAPPIVLGVIKVQEHIIPVVNIRNRFRLQEREMGLSDHIIIAQTSKRRVAFFVDAVHGIFGLGDRRVVTADEIVPSLRYVEGIVQMDDGLIIIHDLDQFLSLDEEQALDNALAKKGANNAEVFPSR
jgi:purine-binding chemotaxis protein CheW